jgi:hypothetical protein
MQKRSFHVKRETSYITIIIKLHKFSLLFYFIVFVLKKQMNKLT